MLFLVFFVHLAVASGKQAYMILMRRAVDELREAQAQGVSLSRMSSWVLRKETGQHAQSLLDSEYDEDHMIMSCVNTTTTTHDIQNDLIECRDKSSSVWLHFPHLELVFLLFAFQGVVASQAQVIHHTGRGCAPVTYTAITLLVRRDNLS